MKLCHYQTNDHKWNIIKYIRLIAAIRKIVLSVRTIERHVNGTGPKDHETTTPAGIIPRSSLESFRLSLDTKCPIPLDLLDLMDVGHPFGTNPQVYARGLMKEAVRQLEGLERRKRGLGMLAYEIERGLDQRKNDDGLRSRDDTVGSGRKESDEASTRENEAEHDASKLKVDEGLTDGITEPTNKRKREDDVNDSQPVVKKERTETTTETRSTNNFCNSSK